MNIEVPEEDRTDLAHAATRGVLGAIPWAGSMAQELWDRAVVPPYRRRLEQFFHDVATELDSAGARLDDLEKDDRFTTVVIEAAQCASRTHDPEKRCALRNAVLHAARASEDADTELVFLALLDSLTPPHLKVLKLLDGPESWFQAAGVPWRGYNSISPMIEGALGFGRDLQEAIVADLHVRGLLGLDRGSLHTMMSSNGPRASRTTDLGKRFLRFVSAPTP